MCLSSRTRHLLLARVAFLSSMVSAVYHAVVSQGMLTVDIWLYYSRSINCWCVEPPLPDEPLLVRVKTVAAVSCHCAIMFWRPTQRSLEVRAMLGCEGAYNEECRGFKGCAFSTAVTRSKNSASQRLMAFARRVVLLRPALPASTAETVRIFQTRSRMCLASDSTSISALDSRTRCGLSRSCSQRLFPL